MNLHKRIGRKSSFRKLNISTRTIIQLLNSTNQYIHFAFFISVRLLRQLLYCAIEHHSQFNPCDNWRKIEKKKKQKIPPKQQNVHDTHNGKSVWKQWNSCELFTVHRRQYTSSHFVLSFLFSFSLLLYNSYYVIRNHKQLLSTFLYFHFYDPDVLCTLSCTHPRREIGRKLERDAARFIYSFILLHLVPLGFA